MKVAFHTNQLGERGTETALFKYAKYNRDILGNESVIVSSSSKPTPSLEKFSNEFKVFLYPYELENNGLKIKNILEKMCDKENITHFYAMKYGNNDGIMPSNAKTLAHCVFVMSEPHANVYASISKYISDKFGSKYPYIDYIMEKEEDDDFIENYREELNIPKNALVLGRHGGKDTFNLGFVHDVVKKIIDQRKDLYFVFLNTNEFIKHDRIKYIPYTYNDKLKSKFINTCDAMIHARYDGETFGLAVGEFAIRNKPIITWKPEIIPNHYDYAHISILKEKGIYYQNDKDLEHIFLNISKADIENFKCNAYCDFTPEKVMEKFKDVFINIS